MKFSIEKFRPKPLRGLECLNCGQPMSGHENYCSYCGQKNTMKKLSIGVFFNNIVSGLFSYDSRFWRTFIPLLIKPGKVSKEFISGRRVRFVNPFQMYLNVSLVFFLVLGISKRLEVDEGSQNILNFTDSSKDSLVVNQAAIDSAIVEAKAKLIESIPIDSSKTEVVANVNEAFEMLNLQSADKSTDSIVEYVYHINRDSTKSVSVFKRIQDFERFHEKNKEIAVSQALDSLGYEKTFWNKFYFQQVQVGHKNIEKFKEDKGKEFFKNLMSQISIALFVFLPVFTLFLKLIYIRRKFTYMEHLVFVFHTQTVFFLLLTIFYLLNFMVELTNYSWVFIILFLIYLYKALRYFYQQRRFKTIVKFVLLNTYYLFLGMIGLAIVSVLSFLTA